MVKQIQNITTSGSNDVAVVKKELAFKIFVKTGARVKLFGVGVESEFKIQTPITSSTKLASLTSMYTRENNIHNKFQNYLRSDRLSSPATTSSLLFFYFSVVID